MKKTLQENDYFEHTDISLIATLCCYGYQVEAIDKQNSSKVIFLIKRDEQLDDLIQKYWISSASSMPMSYFNFLKELKTRIYSE